MRWNGISKFAVPVRKAKLKFMWRSARLPATLTQSCQPTAASASNSSHCAMRARDDGRLTISGQSVPRRQGLQPALVGQVVHAARQAQSFGTESGVINFGIAANILEDALGPFVVDAKQLAEVAFQAKEAADIRVGGVLAHLVG